MSNKIVYTPQKDIEYTFKYWNPKKKKLEFHSFVLTGEKKQVGEHIRYEFYCTDLKCLTEMRDDRFSFLRAKWFKSQKIIERAVQLEIKMSKTPYEPVRPIMSPEQEKEQQIKIKVDNFNSCLKSLNAFSSEEVATFENKGYSYINIKKELETAIKDVQAGNDCKLSCFIGELIIDIYNIEVARKMTL